MKEEGISIAMQMQRPLNQVPIIRISNHDQKNFVDCYTIFRPHCFIDSVGLALKRGSIGYYKKLVIINIIAVDSW